MNNGTSGLSVSFSEIMADLDLPDERTHGEQYEIVSVVFEEPPDGGFLDFWR